MGKAEQLKQAAGNMKESLGGGATGGRAIPAKRGPAPREVGTRRPSDAFLIELDQIVPDPDQPRKEFDPVKLDRLADSLRRRGQLMPIRARFSESLGKWVVVAGERRLRAAVMAGLKELAVVESKVLDTSQTRMDQLIENMLREDLRPIEEAEGFRELMDLNGWTQVDLAEHLSIAQSKVAQGLKLLELPEAVRARVEDGTVSAAVAYEISKVEDPAAQANIAERVVGEKLTRSEVRDEVKEVVAAQKAKQPSQGKPRPAKEPAARVKVPEKWAGKAEGYAVEIRRKRGFDWAGAAQALRKAATTIETDHGLATF